MYKSNEILEIVNAHIDNLPYDRKPASLYAPVKYVLSAGGKRIRPCLVLMAYNLFSDDVKEALPIAAALETYHNFTLLHDDLMDNADVRHGRPTVHRKWNANTAILSGDTMLCLAYEHLSHCAAHKFLPLQKLFTETALQISEGQQYDMEFETRTDVTEDEYIEMIRLKTSVLLACALKCGAIAADASCDDADLLYRFGEKIGLAFQLQDDLLDVYGNPEIFGKAIGGDIVSNKKTYMLINAQRLATGDDEAELNHWLTAESFNHDEKIIAVTEIYNRLGIRQMAQEKINQYFAESQKYLDCLSVDASKTTELREYTDRMMKRNK